MSQNETNIDSESDWVKYGLPDECPECGEEKNLVAHVEEASESDGPLVAEITCMRGMGDNPGESCLNTWRWEAEEVDRRTHD